ncbi:MAG: diadenylate cyclase CdaA [Oscillospiraceae bacterium]|nr:diadenylate cyclase CdaA [Oscillospiraceae bacterium]MDD7429007.1 diadenylate cyclase CdaA [Oscillospiraceae bacterium]MDY2847566.1 diadenylate cyclase CdaA [Oscillospiraceae bacterium]
MDYLYEIGSTIASILPITFYDVLDIMVLSYLLYKSINFMKETRAGGLIKGVIVIAIVYLLAIALQMKAMSFLLKTVMEVGLFAIIVLFQPELRRTLEKLGHTNMTKIAGFGSEAANDAVAKWNTAIDAICEACDDLSATTTGALIVIEMETKLGEQIDNGTIINAVPSKELFGTIFFPKTPLHDGAAIIRNGMVIAAGCFLPKPQNEERIDKKLGSRHRAAIGMSENSDAIIVVVSEETGFISVAENGELSRGYDRDSLKKYLRDRILNDKIARNQSSNKPKQPKLRRTQRNKLKRSEDEE